uniref:DUF4178 domain-containing protein n=1 Tax=uncultured prokaryote AT3 TaxID=672202 RepID=D3W8H0_9ZZZZ|nr:conserved hypothetical protein [uncultured prokaryote AT3]
MAKTASCPSCGAPVTFRSVASVLAVCDYCQSTLVRDGVKLENLGKMAEFLDDRSPLQRGSEGRWKGRHFGLIGRLQLKYEAGLWNEWHLFFDDGKSGWLSEAGGELVISEPVRIPEELPAFDTLVIGESIRLAGQAFQVTNILTAECVAGEGELPFKVGAGYPAPVVDLRDSNGRFATIDYSDATAPGVEPPVRPLVFIGEAVPFGQLAMTNLRDPAAGGKPNVKAKAFQCPQCGAPLSARSAEIISVGCGSCGAVVDTQKDVAKRIATAKSKQKVTPLLELGSSGKLFGEQLEVIGFMQRRMQADDHWYFWREYVLLAPDNSLRWLSEYDGHWNLARVQSKAVAAFGETVKFAGQEYKHFQTYEAFVDFVIGEFPWLVKVDQSARVHDYVAPPLMLSREVTSSEDVWTASEYVATADIELAFGLKTPLPKPIGTFANQPNPGAERHRKFCQYFWRLFFAAWAIHLGLLIFGGGTVLKEDVSYRNDSDEARLSKEFVLPRGAHRLEIAHNAQFSNHWLALHMALVNKDTGEAWQTDREISFYEGIDDGESWSEGAKNDEIVFTELPAGTYFLAEEAELDPAIPSVGGQVRISHAGPRWSSLVLLILFLVAFPVFTWWRQKAFEIARWADSDHPIVSASSDDSDDD